MSDTKAASRAISKILSVIIWGFLAFLTIKYFYPEVAQIAFIRIFGAVFRWIYYIFMSFTLVLSIPSIIILYMFIYGSKFDNSKVVSYNPNEKTPLWKSILSWTKSIAIAFFAAKFYPVVSVLSILSIILGLVIQFAEKDLSVKIAVLALNSEEKPSENEFMRKF